MAEGQYRIIKAQLPLIGGLAGHNFLVLIDPNGKVVGELHGLATDAEGHPKPIGNLPSDRLQSHSYNQAKYYDPEQAQTTLASGDQAKIMNLWTAATAAGNIMNARDIHYPWMGLGQNSNSFASTLIASMGLTEPPLPGGASVMPGAGSMLLDPRDMQDIRRQFNIGASGSGDAPNARSDQDGIGQPSPLDTARWPFGPVGAPNSPRSAVRPEQNLPSIAVPGAAGPTSLGTPNGPAPLVPPLRSRTRASSGPAADPTVPQSFGVPRASPAATPPAVLGGTGPIGDGNGIGIGDGLGSTASRAGLATTLFEDRWNALRQEGQPAPSGRDVPRLDSYGLPTASQLMFDPGSLRAPAQSFGAAPDSASALPQEAVRRLTRVNASNSGNAVASGNAPANATDGVLASEPNYPIPPPIWGSENRSDSRNEAEEWFARWIRPLLQRE